MPGNEPLDSVTSPPLIDLTPLTPSKLFDDFYFVGTKSVGAFVINTSDGLIILDTGWGENDCSQFVADMSKLGLNPLNIKLILISHEHLDHYGGVQYLKSKVCPKAKVAMSTLAWNYLQARPAEPPGRPYSNPRPQTIDIFLSDGKKVILGETEIQIIATPGHSPGCVSFIIPVTDTGKGHMVGIMGGGGLNPDWERAYLYKSSIEYFKKFTRAAKCDAGFSPHPWIHWDYETDIVLLKARKPGDPNPLVIGTEKFESIYLQRFRDTYNETVKRMPPESLPPPISLKR